MSASAESGAAAFARPTKPRRIWTGLQPYVLLLPAAAFVLGITVYPIARLFEVSLHATRYFRVGAWNGGVNFLTLFSPGGARSALASAIFVVASDILTLMLALTLALVMEGPLRGRAVLRTLLMAPWLVSQVVTALLWQGLVDPNFGPVTELVRAITGVPVSPLSSETGAMAMMVIANVWRSYPFALILLLAALQAIPGELYEAARVDGASRWQELRHIAVPIAGRTISVVMALLTFDYFTLVTLPFIMTGGGPNEATYVLSLRTWREAFTNYHFGYSAATGVVIFLLNLVLAVIYLRMISRGGPPRVPR